MNQTTTKAPRRTKAFVGAEHAVGTEMATWLAEHKPAVLPLLAQGWTITSAMDHVEGVCDRVLCSARHSR